MSVLAEQLFGTELDAEYESKLSQLLDNNTLREWVFMELSCQIANDSFKDEELKYRFYTMQRLAQTNPEALVPWIKEHPASRAKAPSMIEVPNGVCGNWRIIFSADGGTWLHGDWMQSDTKLLIPWQAYTAYMERMECVKRL